MIALGSSLLGAAAGSLITIAASRPRINAHSAIPVTERFLDRAGIVGMPIEQALVVLGRAGFTNAYATDEAIPPDLELVLPPPPDIAVWTDFRGLLIERRVKVRLFLADDRTVKQIEVVKELIAP